MDKYLDKKTFFTGLAVIIVAVLLQKLFIKRTVDPTTGEETIKFGHPAFGHA